MTQALWYLSRGTGVVALLLLTAAVLLGILTTVRWAVPWWPRFVTTGLHRNISLVVLALLGVHIATAVIDPYAPISWLDAVLPLHGTYRPFWLGMGALAFDLLIALIVTSLARGRLGLRAWRAVHWTAYACWPVALLHGLGTGSDTRLRWVVLLTAGCALAVLAAVGWRILAARGTPVGLRAAYAGLAVAVPLAVAVWAVGGPLQPGWARRAGTPASLLAQGASTVVAGRSAGGSSAGRSFPTLPASGPIQGTLRQSGGGEATGDDGAGGGAGSGEDEPGGLTTVRMDLVLATSPSLPVRVTLRGAPFAGGGIVLTDGTMRVGTLHGPVTGLSGDTLRARVSGGGRTVVARLDLVLHGGTVGGTGSLGNAA